MIIKSYYKYWFLLLIIFCVFILPIQVLASPESEKLVLEGATVLAKQQYEKALQKFEAASKADPADAEAVFFQGATLNRMARHQKALEQLSRAIGMGCRNSDLSFERGWSLLKLQRFNEAITELEKYEVAHPGRGQTSEFLGRAYLGLKNYSKAEAALNDALRRDPRLKPTVEFYLAALEELRNNPEVAKEHLRKILVESPDSSLGQTLTKIILRPKPWQLNFSSAAGYNSNVINLGDELVIPSDISHTDATFERLGLTGSYEWQLTTKDAVTAGYNLVVDLYQHLSSANLLDHYFFTTHRHNFNRNLSTSIRFSNEYTQVGGSNFRNQIGLRPAMVYRATDWLATELAYSCRYGDYYFDTPSVQNRDGFSHNLGLTSYIHVPKTQLNVLWGYAHTWNRADGMDFDFYSNAYSIGLEHPLIFKIVGEVNYTRTMVHYNHPNSLAGTGFQFVRKDHIDIMSVQFSRPLPFYRGLRAYARYDYNRDISNIPTYNFNQYVYTGGIIYEF